MISELSFIARARRVAEREVARERVVDDGVDDHGVRPLSKL